MSRDRKDSTVKMSRFPPSLFGVFLGSLLLLSGIHTGLFVLADTVEIEEWVQPTISIAYWSGVAALLTIYTRKKMRDTMEKPVQELGRAAAQVASGDFSIYVPPLHTEDRYDYLDALILDFDKMVAELGSIETLKTDFFSNVSHEIKSPLAVIQNTSQLLKSNDISPVQRLEYADTIERYSRRLSDLIGNILRLNKLEKQTIRPRPEPYNLCAQLAECALLFENQWEKKTIEFDAEMEERVEIEADESLLELVWNNLLSNAVKFTRAGGSIALRQISDENTVTVSVADTGCGMNEETMQHIFDKFYQGDTSHATEGNGLGLALARRIIELSGGSISVDSIPGKGSTFTVILSLHPEKGMLSAAKSDVSSVVEVEMLPQSGRERSWKDE